jgi:hypothetical protein
VLGEYDLGSDALEVLSLAARALDRVDVLEAEFIGQPAMVSGSMGQPRAHPLLAEIRAEAALAARLLGQLGLDAAEDAPETAASAASDKARRAARARWDHRGGVKR